MELPLLVKEAVEHPLTACAVASLLGGIYWKAFQVVTAVKKATTNELPHIQASVERQEIQHDAMIVAINSTTKAIDRQTDLLEKVALRDCPLLRANAPDGK